MLTSQDIEFMKQTRKEVVSNRQTLITIVYESAGVPDEFTGETSLITTEDSVLSVVTEISSASGAGVDRDLFGGIAVEKGDIWLSIAYELITDIDTLARVIYAGESFEVLAVDRKGIGEIIRVEVLGRELS